MLISYNWLKDYIELDLAAEKLGDELTMAGFTMDSVERQGDDFILDLDITTNRPDCMNHFGLVREISAILGKPVKFNPSETVEAFSGDAYPVEIKAPDLCPRYSAVLLIGVRNDSSPSWISERLRSIGLRSVNGVVDITNFVLHELGHPLHAFDNNRLKDGKVVVRRAACGEKIKLIDGSEKILNNGILVIADTEKPVALAGVMGGKESEVSCSSTDILIESAFFNPASIRLTARDLGMHTDASHRFERGADIGITVKALNRTVALIQKYFGGSVAAFSDNYPLQDKPVEIGLRYTKIFDIIGNASGLDREFIKKTLNNIDIKTTEETGDVLKVSIPSFRRYDLTREIDLIEEVARLYGCEKIVPCLPARSTPSAGITPSERIKRKVCDCLCDWGFSEAINYCMVDGRSEKLFSRNDSGLVALRNPLSEDASVLRSSLYQGLLKSVVRNHNMGSFDLKLFETGTVFEPSEELADEKYMLGLSVSGKRNRDHWMIAEGEDADIYFLKGIVHSLTGKILRRDAVFVKTSKHYFCEGLALELVIEGRIAGEIGAMTEETLQKFGIEVPVFCAQLDMDIFCSTGVAVQSLKTLPRVPGMTRELAFISPVGKEYGAVRQAVESLNIDILGGFEVVDVYSGKSLPEGRKSFLLRFRLQPMDKTLTHSEVVAIERMIVEKLQAGEGLELRGTLDNV